MSIELIVSWDETCSGSPSFICTNPRRQSFVDSLKHENLCKPLVNFFHWLAFPLGSSGAVDFLVVLLAPPNSNSYHDKWRQMQKRRKNRSFEVQNVCRIFGLGNIQFTWRGSEFKSFMRARPPFQVTPNVGQTQLSFACSCKEIRGGNQQQMASHMIV